MRHRRSRRRRRARRDSPAVGEEGTRPQHAEVLGGVLDAAVVKGVERGERDAGERVCDDGERAAELLGGLVHLRCGRRWENEGWGQGGGADKAMGVRGLKMGPAPAAAAAIGAACGGGRCGPKNRGGQGAGGQLSRLTLSTPDCVLSSTTADATTGARRMPCGLKVAERSDWPKRAAGAPLVVKALADVASAANAMTAVAMVDRLAGAILMMLAAA